MRARSARPYGKRACSARPYRKRARIARPYIVGASYTSAERLVMGYICPISYTIISVFLEGRRSRDDNKKNNFWD